MSLFNTAGSASSGVVKQVLDVQTSILLLLVLLLLLQHGAALRNGGQLRARPEARAPYIGERFGRRFLIGVVILKTLLKQLITKICLWLILFYRITYDRHIYLFVFSIPTIFVFVFAIFDCKNAQ